MSALDRAGKSGEGSNSGKTPDPLFLADLAEGVVDGSLARLLFHTHRISYNIGSGYTPSSQIVIITAFGQARARRRRCVLVLLSRTPGHIIFIGRRSGQR